MRALLRLVSLRHFRRHGLRALLTSGGIALGVAAVVAIGLVNASVTLGLRRIAEELAGDAQLVVSGDRTGVPEELLERVKAVKGVVRATPVIKQTVELRSVDGRPARGRLQIYAVDSLDDGATGGSAFKGQALRLPDPVRFLSQPRSAILTSALARRLGVEGQLNRARIVVAAGGEPVELTVRGLLEGHGPGDVYGGNLLVMDTYSAQKVFGRGARFDEIQVALREHAPLEEIAAARAALAAAVGPAFDVARPLDRGRQSERIVHAWQAAVGLLSIVTLFVGAFLIYNTVAVSVAERRREIGILRALGVRRAQIAALILVETTLLALLGGAAGLVAGLAGARALLLATTRMMSQLLLEISVAELRVTPAALAAGLGAGLLLAAGAALLPALGAARVPPLDALRPSTAEARRAPRTAGLAAAGAVLLLAALAGCLLPASRRSELLATTTLLSLLAGFVLVCPLLVQAALGALVPALARAGAVGRVTAGALRRAPLRATVTACAIAIGCALVISSSTVAQSFRVSIAAYVARTTVADLLVSCSSEIFSPSSLPMAPEVGRALAAHPDVAEVQRVRVVDLDLDGRRADLFALDAAAWERRVGFPFLRGDPRAAARALAAGEGVAVSENFAATFRLDVGAPLTLRTPRGPVTLPIVGVFLDYSTAFGAVVLDRAVYRRYWDDDLTDLYHVYLRPGADAHAVQSQLREAVADRYNVFVLTTGEVRERIGGMLDDCFLLIRLQDLVAAAVAILGLVNTLIIAVLERRREIAVLRSMGASRGQIAACVVLESIALALVGFVLGAALGLGLGWINVAVVSTLHTGWRFAVHVNLTLALELLGVVLAAAVAAAWLPARRAAAGEITRGLAVE